MLFRQEKILQLKSSAAELETDTKTESGGVLNVKDDDEKSLDEVCQLAQSDGSSFISLASASASDAGDDDREDDSEDLVLSDEALETLDRELDVEEIDVVQLTDKLEKQVFSSEESADAAEEIRRQENSEEILTSNEKAFEKVYRKGDVEVVSLCESRASEELTKNENEEVSTSDGNASKEVCKKGDGEVVLPCESQATEELIKKENEEILTSRSKVLEKVCRKGDGEVVSSCENQASEELTKKENEGISTSDGKASKELCEDSDEKSLEKENGEDTSTTDSKASEELCKYTDEENSAIDGEASQDSYKQDNDKEILTDDGKVSAKLQNNGNNEDISTDELVASEEICKQANVETIAKNDNKALQELYNKNDNEAISTCEDMAAYKKRGEGFIENLPCEEKSSEEVDVPTSTLVRELSEKVDETNVEKAKLQATDNCEEQIRQGTDVKESEGNYVNQNEMPSRSVAGANLLLEQSAHQAGKEESTEEWRQTTADALSDGTVSGLGDKHANEESGELSLTGPNYVEEQSQHVPKLVDESAPTVLVETEIQASKSEVASGRSDEDEFRKAVNNFAGKRKKLQDALTSDTGDTTATANELDIQQSSFVGDGNEDVAVDDQTKTITDIHELPIYMSAKSQDFPSLGDDVLQVAAAVLGKDIETADNLLNVSELEEKHHTSTKEDSTAMNLKELTPGDRLVTLDAVRDFNEDFGKLVGEESTMVENREEVPEIDGSLALSATNIPKSESPVGEMDLMMVETVYRDPEQDIVIPDEEATKVVVHVSEESASSRESPITDGDIGDIGNGFIVPHEEKPACRAQQTNGKMTNGNGEVEDESMMHDISLEDEVYVTAITGDGHFWSHFSSLTNPTAFYKLQESLNEYYGDGEKQESDCTWKEGDLCAVLSCAEESKWCRAEVTSINAPSTPTKKKAGFLSRLLTKKSEGGEQSDGNCIVRLLDSGMQEMVPQKALRPLDARFQALPPQAKLCHLDAASNLAPHGVERLEELLAHQTFRAVVRMGAGDILTCSDIPLVLFPSKDRDETTTYTENKVGKPTESINQKLQSEGLVQM